MAQAANSALYSARLRFVEGLPARAHELSSTAERLVRDPNDPEAAGILRRRLHALLASAQVFEEPALSLAVQDLLGRLDVTQRGSSAFTSEEIDALMMVVASLPTYVRPTSLPPRAAYSDVRELREDAELHELPMPSLSDEPLLIDLPLALRGDQYAAPAPGALDVPRSSAADLHPPPQELAIDVELPPSDAERIAIAELDRALGIEPEAVNAERPLLGDPRALLELPQHELDVAIDWTALQKGTAESLPPLERHVLPESETHGTLRALDELDNDRITVVPGMPPGPGPLASAEALEDDTTDPGLGPPVLLEQTVSGLLPVPDAVVLLVGELEPAAGLQLTAADIELVRAASADEAVRLLHETRPDLVLISAELASEPGADLVRRLKGDPLTPAASVHVLLPEGETHDQAFMDQIGADGVVRQPLTAAALEPLLSRLGRMRSFGLRDGSVDELAEQIAEEIRRGIAESLRDGKHAGDGSQLMAAAWSAIGRVRSHLAEQSRDRVRSSDDERSLLPPAAAEFAHPAQLLAGCRILVADDDPAVLWFFVGLLREASATVFSAHNGREALDLARRKQPHVIISDILMPKLDGFGLCRELERDALLSKVPVVLLSWKDDLLQRMRELDAGAAGYLRKEAGSQQILSVLRGVLAPRTRLAAQLRAAGDVNGTFEELSVWALLELVAAFRPDAHVVVRDASNMFEVELRSGRRLAVTRTAADGAFTRGEKALMQLLGLGAGEFEVSTSSAALRAALSEPQDRALVAAGRRLSALVDAVSDARLLKVSLLAFDEEVLESMLAGASARTHEVVALFRTGNATAESVLREGRFEPGELERELRDLARGLAITEVWSADGEDLVAAAQREREMPQMALLTSSAPPRARSTAELVERETPVVPVEPARVQEWRRGDDTMIGIGVAGGESGHGHGQGQAQVGESEAAEGGGEVDAEVVSVERGAVEQPVSPWRERGEGLRLTATLVVLAAVGYFGWQELTGRKPNELRPAPPEIVAEPVIVPTVTSANRVPGEPALPNTQLGRILPFIDDSRGVEVGVDEGLLVLEYQGTDPAPSVRVGERELGKPPLAVALPVGRHELVVRAGKSTSFRYLIVRAGETRIVSLPLAEL
jgi:DNA-binding response OmpR family regulator